MRILEGEFGEGTAVRGTLAEGGEKILFTSVEAAGV